LEADLWLRSTAPDTDVFVQLVDQAPDGSRSYLQRGMLRASSRATVAGRADRIRHGGLSGQSYRPYHPFRTSHLLTPGQPIRMQIEVFPVGFVLRAGHDLLVQIYAPPAMDELYAYASTQPPADNTILSSPGHPSSVLVPFLPGLPPLGRTHPTCGSVTGVRCTTPVGG
jgi:predicted acyl esterase